MTDNLSSKDIARLKEIVEIYIQHISTKKEDDNKLISPLNELMAETIAREEMDAQGEEIVRLSKIISEKDDRIKAQEFSLNDLMLVNHQLHEERNRLIDRIIELEDAT